MKTPFDLKPETVTAPAADISEIRRRAARARWDAPREKSVRVTVTIPKRIANKLHAAADAANRPVSALVAQCVKDALCDILLDALAAKPD